MYSNPKKDVYIYIATPTFLSDGLMFYLFWGLLKMWNKWNKYGHIMMAKFCMANLAPMISPGISGVSFEKLAEARTSFQKAAKIGIRLRGMDQIKRRVDSLQKPLKNLSKSQLTQGLIQMIPHINRIWFILCILHVNVQYM